MLIVPVTRDSSRECDSFGSTLSNVLQSGEKEHKRVRYYYCYYNCVHRLSRNAIANYVKNIKEQKTNKKRVLNRGSTAKPDVRQIIVFPMSWNRATGK